MQFSTLPAKKPKGTRQLLNARPNSQWVYMFHPNSWDFIEYEDGTSEWLPLLKKWQQVPGVNGIKGLRGGGINETAAKSRFVDDGWIFIEPEACDWVDNEPNDSGYLRAIEGKYGTVWVDIWALPETIGAGRNATVTFSRDKDGFNEFRRQLLRRDIIPAIQPGVVKLYAKRQRRRADRKVSQIHNPIVAKHIEKEQTKLASMNKTIAKKTPRKRAPKVSRGAKNG